MSHHCEIEHNEPAQGPFRKALWIALVLNLSMFIIEVTAGLNSHSLSLLADAIDFFSDSANYAISLFVLGMSLTVRAKASMVKAATMLILGVFIMATAINRVNGDTVPEAHVMGIIGFMAMVVNILAAVLLYRFRSGDSNMESVWLCSRNDAIGNIAVMLAALGVFSTDTHWPDIAVAGLMGWLAASASFRIFRKARAELKHEHNHKG